MASYNSLDKSNIWIYGTGGNGTELYQRLQSDCSILGFIDKRAEKIKNIFEKPVYTLQQLAGKLSIDEKEKTVIIVTIKNVFMHSGIAKELLENGFSFLIYKPLNILKNRENETDIQVNRIYESIVEKKNPAINMLIPRTTEIVFEFQNKLFISRNGDEVTTWVPVEILFNYKKSYDYPGINMPLFFPLVELYKAFLGRQEISLRQAVDNFYLYCGEWLYKNQKLLTEEQKESFLESRRMIFEEMEKMTEIDIDFFKKNAPLVEKDGKKMFLKSSGRNRVAFLIAKGFKYVPVRMSSLDYEEWCDMELVHKKETMVSQTNIGYFFAPHPNPYLIDYPVYFADYQKLFLQPIANRITKRIYLQSVMNEKGVRKVSLASVEQEKKKIIFSIWMEDDGIAKEYFESIGFSTEGIKEQNSRLEQILIVDDKNYSKYSNILPTGSFQEIYYLQRGNDDTVIRFFEKYGYELNGNIFESICRDDIMRGVSFIKNAEGLTNDEGA